MTTILIWIKVNFDTSAESKNSVHGTLVHLEKYTEDNEPILNMFIFSTDVSATAVLKQWVGSEQKLQNAHICNI